jgi:soluble lytic murein transglycosylase-like protein
MIPLLLSITGFVGSAHAESVVTTQSNKASANDPFASSVVEAAQRFGVPAPWISAVMAMESGGDVLARSPQGAMGLMQIMPDTWANLRTRYGLGGDPYDPRDNILAGAAYMREMHDRYGCLQCRSRALRGSPGDGPGTTL